MEINSSKDSEIVLMFAIMQGQVQGVGFRMKTYSFALQLGLKGTVRNLDDGSVEIYAEGYKDNLLLLITKLQHHFKLTDPQAISVTFSPPFQHYEDFRIID